VNEESFAREFLASGGIFHSTKEHVFIGWGQPEWLSWPKGPYALYFPDFFLKFQAPWCVYPHFCFIAIDELIERLSSLVEIQNPKISWEPLAEEEFKVIFDSLQSDFCSKKLQKAVAYQFQTAKCQNFQATKLNSLISLLNSAKKNALYSYGFWNSKEGILGATPETLFKMQHKETIALETMACAGTQNSALNNDLLLKDLKQQIEHRLVVDWIVDSIDSLGGAAFIGNCQAVKFSRLCHLVTPIKAELPKSTSFDAIVSALHPTPALGAAPRKEGSIWLEKQQFHNKRMRFGAPIALKSDTEALCLVGIRNMQWQDDTLFLGAGCGIVQESSFEDEWQELQLKMAFIKEILGLA